MYCVCDPTKTKLQLYIDCTRDLLHVRSMYTHNKLISTQVNVALEIKVYPSYDRFTSCVVIQLLELILYHALAFKAACHHV